MKLIRVSEQIAFLKSRNKNIIISASAGSGKTTTMKNKIISHLISTDSNYQADLDQILVLTYTKSASEEIVRKIEKALYEESETNFSLQRQLEIIKSADICTFHSFCAKYIKKYFFSCKIDPNFKISEQIESQLLKTKAVRRAITEYKKINSLGYYLLLEKFSEKNDTLISKIILDIFEFLSSQFNYDTWLINTANKLYKTENKVLILNYLNNYICKIYKYHNLRLSKLISKLQNLNLNNFCQNLLPLYENSKKIFIKNDFFTNYAALFENLSFKNIFAKDESLSGIINECNFVIRSFKEDKEKLKNNFNFGDELDIENSFNEGLKIHENILGVYELFRENYKQLKTERNLLDYFDIETNMIKILKNPQIAESIRAQYKFIYIDEYQDTNRIQEQILNSIKRGNNSNYIGDTKQAIFRFRQSTHEMLLDKINNPTHNDEIINLNSNFRSNKQILDFVNMVFNKTMTKENSEVNYKKTSQLRCEIPLELYGNLPAVELNIIIPDKPKKNKVSITGIYSVKNHQNETEQNLKNAQKEARVIAEKILHLRTQKIYDKETEQFRDIKYSDITIIMKSRSGIDFLCEELNKIGIPVLANTNTSLPEYLEIRILLSLLKLCVNPKDDIAICSVLSSSFGKLTYEELATIRIQYNDDRSYFYECVEFYIKNFQDNLTQKLIEFYEFLKVLKNDILIYGVATALYNAILKKDYKNQLLSELNGIHKVKRVESFLYALENKSKYSLSDIISFFESSNQSIMAPNISDSSFDYVNLTTIHASKGLEYPIVFLYNAAADPQKTQPNSKINFNSELGMTFENVDVDKGVKFNSVQNYYCQVQNNREEFAERLRLLYVALTRAKNHLFIVGTKTSSEYEAYINKAKFYENKSYLNLIISTFPKRIINKINSEKTLYINCENQKINIRKVVEWENDENLSKKQKQYKFSKPDPQLQTEISKHISFVYPNSEAVNLAIKNSVSSLAFEEEYVCPNTAPNNLTISEHNILKPVESEVGTCYHKILELINFDEIYTNATLDNYIDNLISKNIIQQKEKSNLDLEKLLNTINIIRSLTQNHATLKEQKFIMQLKHNDIVKNGSDEKILIQGKIDLIILKNSPIIIDYKVSNKKENNLKDFYKKQLLLYREAAQRALNKDIKDVYILEINRSKLIKII